MEYEPIIHGAGYDERARSVWMGVYEALQGEVAEYLADQYALGRLVASRDQHRGNIEVRSSDGRRESLLMLIEREWPWVHPKIAARVAAHCAAIHARAEAEMEFHDPEPNASVDPREPVTSAHSVGKS